MTNVFQKSAKTCEVHRKKSYTTKDLAKQASREMHDPGMREYRCDADTRYWHIGHLPEAVRNGHVTADEHYGRGQFSTPPEAAQPLTFRPSAANIKTAKPSASVVDNSIETLLVAAEKCGVDAAEKLARQIRELLVQLVDEIRIGQQERTLREQIAELETQRDKAIAQLRELRGEPEPAPSDADDVDPGEPVHHWAGAKQGEMRAWARANGYEVPVRGSISRAVADAYMKAMGGGR